MITAVFQPDHSGQVPRLQRRQSRVRAKCRHKRELEARLPRPGVRGLKTRSDPEEWELTLAERSSAN